MALLEPYDRKARLLPGLLGIAPVAVAIATLGVKQFPAVALLLAALSAAGGGYLLAILVARTGRQAQTALWEEWGGRPSTHLLRLREQADNPVQRDAWRKALARKTGVRLATAARESRDPVAADNAIETAVGQMLYLGQDDRFLILKSENAQYGLERNLFGFRWYGRTIALVCAAVLAACLWTDWADRGALIAGVVVCLLVLIAWYAVPSKARIREVGFRYAEQLMRSVIRAEQLDNEAKPSTVEDES
jgi:predicted membrane protein